MKIMNKLRSLSRKTKFAAAALVIAGTAAIAIPVVNAEFGPDRPTYDYSKFDPNNKNCDDANNIAAQNGRCGSMNGPVFNSFTNNPTYGDERSFVDGRKSDAAQSTTADAIQNVNEGSKEVTLRMYVHNNANPGTNCLPVHLKADGTCSQIDPTAKGIAHNAKVRFELPTGTEQVLRTKGYISADNASTVFDSADMLGTEKFSVSYIPGSATLMRNNVPHALSDSIVTSGAQIGNDAMNGELPGCFDYASLITIRVKINVQETPKLQVTKEVKVKGAEGWNKEISTKPNTEIQWRIGTKDISNSNLNNVIVRDVLPPHVKMVPGSLRLISTGSDKAQNDESTKFFFAGGVNVGNYVPGSTQYAIFNTTTQDDFAGCQTRIRNIVHGRSDQTPAEETDTADVIITKENCNETATPAYACNSLTGTVGTNRNVTFNTTASATGGASITLYQYDFGDGTPVFTTNKANVQHAYAKDGNYAARVKVQFAVAGKTVYDEGDKCATPISFTTPGTPATPGAPTVLPNTGAGSVAAMFALTTVAGAVAHRWFLGRRFNS